MRFSSIFPAKVAISAMYACTLLSNGARAAVDPNTELVVGLAGSATSLPLYSKPDNSATAGSESKDQLLSILPLPIVNKRGEFVEVKLNGTEIWLDLMDVQRRFAKSYCADFAGQNVRSVAAARGIGDICE